MNETQLLEFEDRHSRAMGPGLHLGLACGICQIINKLRVTQRALVDMSEYYGISQIFRTESERWRRDVENSYLHLQFDMMDLDQENIRLRRALRNIHHALGNFGSIGGDTARSMIHAQAEDILNGDPLPEDWK